MRLLICILFIIGLSQNVFAQVFETKFSQNYTGSFQSEMLWYDFDHNDQPDMLAIVEEGGQQYIALFENLGLSLSEKRMPITTSGSNTLFAMDYDRNGETDLLLVNEFNGTSEIQLYAQENLDFTLVTTLSLPHVLTQLQWTNLTQTGSNSLVFVYQEGSENQMHEVQIDANGQFSQALVHTFNNAVVQWQCLDYNKDGKNEVLIARDTMLVAYSIALKPTIALDSSHYIGFDRKIKGFYPVDINEDTQYDWYIKGDAEVYYPYLYSEEGYILSTEHKPIQAPNGFVAADYTTDGATDLFHPRERKDTWQLDINKEKTAIQEVLDYVFDRYAVLDLDRDGDLDLVTIDTQTAVIHVVENTEPKVNVFPSRVEQLITFRMEDGVLLYWEPATDILTSDSILTYEVGIGTTTDKNDVVPSGFDVSGISKFKTGPGFNNYSNRYWLRDPEAGQYFASIYALDNAWYSGVSPSDGACERFSFTVTEKEMVVALSVCKDQEITIDSPSGEAGAWLRRSDFNYSYRFEYTQAFSEDDKIYFSGGNGSEYFYVTYVITVVEELDPTPILESQYQVCKGETLSLSLPAAYTDVTWSMMNTEKKVDGNQFSELILEGELVVVSAQYGSCAFEAIFDVTVNELEAEIIEPQTIIKGNSIVLFARGGEEYLWTPGQFLSRTDVPDPICRPSFSIEYSVLVSDLAGCDTLMTTSVEVIQTAFIPELFTPNGDGMNDRLKILGASNVADFSFAVYDRSGTQVYQSNRLDQLANEGWDGAGNGRQLPEGIYYWKVTGQYTDGSKLLINGKEEGSIQLNR